MCRIAYFIPFYFVLNNWSKRKKKKKKKFDLLNAFTHISSRHRRSITWNRQVYSKGSTVSAGDPFNVHPVRSVCVNA